MKNTNNRLLPILFWILNIVTAAMVLLFFAVIPYLLRAGSTAAFMPLLTRLLYIAGLAYILALLNRMIYRVLKGHSYESAHLPAVRRIGYLLLLTPVPTLLTGLYYCLAGGSLAGNGVMTIFDSIVNYWPYVVMGLVVLAIAEVYRTGITYKQELDLTV